MTDKYRFPLILMLFLSITPVMSIYIPRFIAFWPFIIGLCTCYWLLVKKKELFTVSKLYYIVAGAISLLCLLSTLWSISPTQSIGDAMKVTLMLMFGGLLVSSFKALEFEDFKPYGWLFPAGLTLAALLCAFDLIYGLPLYNIVHHSDDLEPNTSVMNRGLICCVFAFFTTLPFIDGLEWKDSRKFMLTAVTGLSMVIVLSLSQSQSAQLAFALGLIAFFAFPSHWKASYILFGLVLIVTLFTTPYIIDFLYRHFLTEVTEDTPNWIRQAYIGNRIEIWNFVMKYAMNNPIYGFGIEATDYVRHFDFDHIYNQKDTVLHPHNFSVQIWIEFGLIGISLVAVTFGILLNAIYRTKNILARKSIATLFIVVLLVAAMTYGLWQSWWIGELLFMLGIGTLLSNQDAIDQ